MSLDVNTRRALARTAAAWWGDLLREARQPSLTRDAGHRSDDAVYMDGLMSFMRPPAIPEDQIMAFEEALVEGILRRCDYAYLSVDYGPEGLLGEVVNQTGVRPLFPFKTKMSICEDGSILIHGGGRSGKEFLCITKRRAVRCIVDNAVEELFVADKARTKTEELLTISYVTMDLLRALPEHPEGDVEQIAATILEKAKARAERGAST